MTKFLLLYTGGKMPESEAEMAAVLKDWENWYTGLGKAVVDPGNPFTPVAKMVRNGGTVSPVPAAGMASGYTLVQAASLDDATGMAKSSPVLKSGGEVSVFETFEVM